MADNPYEGYRVYGPYTRKDNRQHVILFKSKQDKITVSYPKYIMEMKLGRKLTSSEEIHHRNEDFTNNEIDNLQILDTNSHRVLHGIRQPRNEQTFVCPTCKCEFTRSGKDLTNIITRYKEGVKRRGPFCTLSCSVKDQWKKGAW